MRRGIVVEVNPRYSIVLTPDGEYRKVPAGKYQVGEEISLQAARRRRSRGALWYSAAAVMVIMVLIIPNLWPAASAEPAVYVTMDINPSVELGISLQGKVVSLNGLNEDGRRIIDGMSYEGQPVQQVTASIMKRVRDLKYLSDTDNTVLITGIAVEGRDGGQVEEELTSLVDLAVRAAAGDSQGGTEPGITDVQVTRLMAPEELRDASIESGLSPGKLAVFLLAEANGYPLDLTDLKEKSISQIVTGLGGLDKVVGGDTDGSHHLNDLRKLLSLPKHDNGTTPDPENPEAVVNSLEESIDETGKQQPDRALDQEKRDKKDKKEDSNSRENRDKKEGQASGAGPGSKTAEDIEPNETGKAAKAEKEAKAQKEEKTSRDAGKMRSEQTGKSSQLTNSGSNGNTDNAVDNTQDKQSKAAGAMGKTGQTGNEGPGNPEDEEEAGSSSKVVSPGPPGKEAREGKEADAGSPSSSAKPESAPAEQKAGQGETKKQNQNGKESTNSNMSSETAPSPAVPSGSSSAGEADSSTSTIGPAGAGGSPGSAKEPAGKAKMEGKGRDR
ncbi:anti-sigma factor domain-containing protein [Paenibacillus tarimensis]|uniref:anti-sigma factor domain-containing protein n=1 Tax=Paenibacillus tarimensis TaxID=416012 RepID=UPI001F3E18C1|nr:anti-sigma factor domain-containing protein [Paenibacillus tarimensis]MCF2942847.1 anti-sigma factor domain-containing protein [Paenibacillus tarimensis]